MARNVRSSGSSALTSATSSAIAETIDWIVGRTVAVDEEIDLAKYSGKRYDIVLTQSIGGALSITSVELAE